MGHDRALVKLARNGRFSIPARQRKLLNMEHGGLMVAEVHEGELRLRPARTVLAELRDKVSADLARSGDSVDQFIADRRAEAARDET
jgi:bifunctional DNA-binding transcriptional regulator/antitoxin component of YhaV-PrlF toxin-antitoxin module